MLYCVSANKRPCKVEMVKIDNKRIKLMVKMLKSTVKTYIKSSYSVWYNCLKKLAQTEKLQA